MSRPGSPRDASAHPQRSEGPDRRGGPQGPANLSREEWGRRAQGKFVGARGWTGAARVHGLQETRRDGRAHRTRTPWETEKSILGRAFTGQTTASSGGRRPPAPSPSSAFGAGSWRRHRVLTRLRMGGRTRCRGSRETLGSLSSARPRDRSVRPDRPIRLVRRGSSRPQRQATHPPAREPAVGASGVHNAPSPTDVGVTREVRRDPRPAPLPFSSLRQGSKPKAVTQQGGSVYESPARGLLAVRARSFLCGSCCACDPIRVRFRGGCFAPMVVV